ncbi:MAG: hypothetical protein JO159_12965 [Acidobacteria bacterium]|nr:hypothetical protein [Acidobacteriota bacterium]MBV9624740.1 hypothetical protein [Acidobacteriota bacterium]
MEYTGTAVFVQAPEEVQLKKSTGQRGSAKNMLERAGVGTVNAEEVEHNKWKKAFRISNDTVELVVLTEVGPRILFFGFLGTENEFHEIPGHSGKSGDQTFRVYGGHRLWVSPEVSRTYYPDNFRVSVRNHMDSFLFTAPPESTPPGTHLQKEIEIRLAETGARVTVTHRIRNVGIESTEMAAWALSVMAGGGRAILPLPPKAPMSTNRLLPEGVLALWSYTDLADPRWKIGTKYIQLQQTSLCSGTFKQQMGGIFNPFGWGAYFRKGHLFVKKTNVGRYEKYPDFGCNFEIYTDADSLELETLGPLRILRPGETAEHIEQWWLFKDIPGGEDEGWIDSAILPTIEQAK